MICEIMELYVKYITSSVQICTTAMARLITLFKKSKNTIFSSLSSLAEKILNNNNFLIVLITAHRKCIKKLFSQYTLLLVC